MRYPSCESEEPGVVSEATLSFGTIDATSWSFTNSAGTVVASGDVVTQPVLADVEFDCTKPSENYGLLVIGPGGSVTSSAEVSRTDFTTP